VNLIDHPGLVDIYEFGHLPDGTAFIVMEFLKGESLSTRLARSGGRLSPEDTLRLGKQVASALAAAHAKAIVHRDFSGPASRVIPRGCHTRGTGEDRSASRGRRRADARQVRSNPRSQAGTPRRWRCTP
jgi:hypothetical protein